MSGYGNKKWKVEKGNPQIAGVTRWNEGYNFTAVLGDFKEAKLLLYKPGNIEPMGEIPVDNSWRMGNVISMWIEGLNDNLEYNYFVDGKIVTDPRAKALTGRKNFGKNEDGENPHEVRAMLNAGLAMPTKVSSVKIPYEDMILYKLHVRGFTKGKNSKTKKKGTFLGLTEKIPYLRSLGITSVELMPAYEFQEFEKPSEDIDAKYQKPLSGSEKVNYWGYSKGFYFAPKSAYCAGKDCIREFQTCIDSFHQAGMEVIMEFFFEPHESPIKIIEILRYWAWFYHVDGFHLTGNNIPSSAIARDELLKGVKIFSENYDEVQLKREEKAGRKRLALCNRDFLYNARCFLKGDENQVAGFVWKNRRNPKNHGIINYITNQDGFTLSDLVSYDRRHNEDNGENNRDGSVENFSWNCGIEGETRRKGIAKLRMQQMKNAFLLMLLSQGVPMIYSGDEMGNTQKGNNNAWCQDNELGWTDWPQNQRSSEIREFVKNAIDFRKKHRILHLEREIRDTDYRSLGAPEISYHGSHAWFSEMESGDRSVAIMYCGEYAEEEDLYIIYNMHWQEQQFALPLSAGGKQWMKIADTGVSGNSFFDQPQSVEDEEERRIVISPRSIVILTAGSTE